MIAGWYSAFEVPGVGMPSLLLESSGEVLDAMIVWADGAGGPLYHPSRLLR